MPEHKLATVGMWVISIKVEDDSHMYIARHQAREQEFIQSTNLQDIIKAIKMTDRENGEETPI